MQCIDHLKNLTLAMVNHEATSGRLPSSGWSGNWTGDPDRGTGAEQPGCWAYSVLPFIEEQAIYDLRRGYRERREVVLQKSRRDAGSHHELPQSPFRRTLSKDRRRQRAVWKWNWVGRGICNYAGRPGRLRSQRRG